MEIELLENRGIAVGLITPGDLVTIKGYTNGVFMKGEAGIRCSLPPENNSFIINVEDGVITAIDNNIRCRHLPAKIIETENNERKI